MRPCKRLFEPAWPLEPLAETLKLRQRTMVPVIEPGRAQVRAVQLLQSAPLLSVWAVQQQLYLVDQPALFRSRLMQQRQQRQRSPRPWSLLRHLQLPLSLLVISLLVLPLFLMMIKLWRQLRCRKSIVTTAREQRPPSVSPCMVFGARGGGGGGGGGGVCGCGVYFVQTKCKDGQKVHSLSRTMGITWARGLM